MMNENVIYNLTALPQKRYLPLRAWICLKPWLPRSVFLYGSPSRICAELLFSCLNFLKNQNHRTGLAWSDKNNHLASFWQAHTFSRLIPVSLLRFRGSSATRPLFKGLPWWCDRSPVFYDWALHQRCPMEGAPDWFSQKYILLKSPTLESRQVPGMETSPHM